mmetsp:Transcript_117862/g.334193  ORF Transcript_117862/g.334193 Transcript_117862/m.334193 type:complete len:179 (-) Transcript_117862:81-617(-)
MVSPFAFFAALSAVCTGAAGLTRADPANSPCKEKLVHAREDLATQTLALNAKEQELADLKAKVGQQDEKGSAGQLRTIKRSIASVNQEIAETQKRLYKANANAMKSEDEFATFRTGYIASMKKHLQEFKTAAEAKIEALEKIGETTVPPESMEFDDSAADDGLAVDDVERELDQGVSS